MLKSNTKLKDVVRPRGIPESSNFNSLSRPTAQNGPIGIVGVSSPPSNRAAWLAARPVGYFTIEPWGNGWALTVHRIGKPPETLLAATPGELNRLRMKLTDSGLVGYAPGGMR